MASILIAKSQIQSETQIKIGFPSSGGSLRDFSLFIHIRFIQILHIIYKPWKTYINIIQIQRKSI